MSTRGPHERGKADMHLHTLYSDGTAEVQSVLDHVEESTDLDLVAIADHERIDGALRAREIHAAGDYSFELVVGEEVTSRRGHVIALFIEERIPSLRPITETLERIHDQGGLAIAAHPMAPLTPSLGTRTLLELHDDPDPRHHLDAIELMNPSAAGRSRRLARLHLNERRLHLPGVGNSDAHVLRAHRQRMDLVPRLERRALPQRHPRPRRRGRWRALGQLEQRGGLRSPAGCQGSTPAPYSASHGRVAMTKLEQNPIVVDGAPAAAAPSGQLSRGRPPLKIAIVSPYGYPHPGGVNEHVRHTYQAMRRLGHDAWIITSRYGKERESEGHIIRLGTGYAFPANGSMGRLTLSWRFKQRARDLLAEHRFDILHFHEPLVPFLSPTMLDQSNTVNIGTFHAFGGFSPSYWVGKRFAHHLVEKLDGRIAVSGAARHFIGRYFPGDYRIIPNGVDLDRFADGEPFDELRDGTVNILFVGRFEERKGLIHLLRAYHRLRKRHVDARLLVIGTGPKAREYRRFVGLRQIRDVEWLGRVADDDKARYFASADIFCSPATGQESFGIVLLEAMAAGTPIVASDIHGYKNVMQRGVQGLLVEPRNAMALAAGLYKLATDEELRNQMGEAGRLRAPDYSWERVTERIIDYYHEVRDGVLASGRP